MYRLTLALCCLLAAGTTQAQSLLLRIMETSDLHAQIMDFDYYTDQPTDRYGLVRTASLIHAARAEVKNALLVDNGDLIQGSALAEYWAAKAYSQGSCILFLKR